MAKVKEFCKNGHNLSTTRKQGPTGTPYCKVCKSAYAINYMNTNQYQRTNNSWRHKLKKLYDLTEQEYIDIYVKQDGKCAICRSDVEYRGSATHMDHCHNSGAIREILCSHCNTAIGLLKENTEIMYRAIEYIKKHKQ